MGAIFKNSIPYSGSNGSSLPDGGTTGQALVKKSNTDQDVEWGTIEALPSGGTQGQALIKQSSTDGDADWEDIDALPSGGTTGQVLTKQSSTDGDADWDDVPVETVELTESEFDQLTPAEKDNGITYFIKDSTVINGFTVLGNRFDKANIYTADERMIGSWMGKPLYQKVIDCGNIPSGSQSGYAMYTFEEGISDARLINACCYNTNGLNQSLSYINPATSSTEIGFQMIHNSTNGRYQLMLRTSSDRSSFGKVLAIVQYTKSSDATVNIGTQNDYSTDEQIIGTWIDGKRLYQVTYANLDITTSPNTWTTTNISLPTNFEGFKNAIINDGTGAIGYFNVGGENGKITLYNSRDTNQHIDTITVQYTKTTD